MSSNLDERISGTVRSAIILEFLRNSFHFPLANILLELVIEGPKHYFTSLDFFASLAAPMIQAVFMGYRAHNRTQQPLLGNLIGPLIYSVIDYIGSPAGFFEMPYHYAYWGFALAIGIIQQLHLTLGDRLQFPLIIMENLVRSSILAAMYWIIERLTEPKYMDTALFFQSKSHVFILLALLFLSIVVGFDDARAQHFLRMLRDTTHQLTTYSRWLLGRNMLSLAISSPESLSLARRERSVLFMDIRGFTLWSEQQPPETVVSMLNRYYELAETLLSGTGVIQFKYTADEIMAFFAEPQDAVLSALRLQEEGHGLLEEYGLSAGTGVHSGPVVEGLLGSSDLKRYDILGDTVNTAKRISSEAAGGELLLSSEVFSAVADSVKLLEEREISVKGKSQALVVYVVASRE